MKPEMEVNGSYFNRGNGGITEQIKAYNQNPQATSTKNPSGISDSQSEPRLKIKSSREAKKNDIEGLFKKASQLSNSSKNSLYPDQVECVTCKKSFSEFNCLKWNYEFYC